MPAAPSLLIVPYRSKTGKLYSQIPTSGAGDFTVTRNTEARRFNSAGLIESVASGIPRLDYYTSGGTAGCPAFLVEPSGTNLFARSNELNIGSPWTQDNISFTTGSTSAFTSPDGTTNSFLLADTSGNTRHRISQQPTTSFVSGTTYTVSIFVKRNSSGRFLLLNANAAFGARAVLNLDTLAITNIDGSGASVENYGNGWYRFMVRGTATSTQATSVFIQMQDAATDVPYIGNGSSFYLFGAQLETGSVATSYIPTTAGTGSRSADVVSVSGAVSGSIGQTEGTIYLELVASRFGTEKMLFQIDNGTATQRVAAFYGSAGNITFATASGSQYLLSTGANLAAGTHKVALTYSSGNLTAYVNGAFYVSGTPSHFPSAALNNISLGSRINAGVYGIFLNDRIRAAALYTTRLTNAELAALTSP